MIFRKIIFVGLISSVLFSCNNDEKATTSPNPTTTPQARTTTPKKFLFDATKAQTAGNADWVICENSSGTPIRYPSPLQSTVTATTSENYWRGGLSAWGIALVKEGHTVETLAPGAAITYGNTSNPQDLSNYNVYIVDEPNTLFTAAQKTAIINFVKNGGGLLMIANHNGSDRNNDGKDSAAIWNDLMTNNSVQTNPFGLAVELTNFSQTTTNILNDATNTILNGSQGAVTQLKFSAGSSIKITPSANAAVKGLIWKTGLAKTSTTGVMCASSTYFNGRVFLITDSSPADDGTGNPSDTLYPGWTEVSGNHSRLHLNASYWLAKLQ
ncbi:hydrolase [Flavobacterium sp. CYK-4]|uniref:hydrolase n=1 Tax=Flavobacterium lotistagni TaxID=2709660 RepID=UPI00140BFCB4|nr:hydrolase [Flavobacterium lotistagni]NHM06732.1 hydrolase [Flavobacterium lotistagni]